MGDSTEIDRHRPDGSGLLAASSPERATAPSTQYSRWLLREIALGTPAYSIAATTRFPGKPDIVAMRYALRLLAARHSSLRMNSPRGGEPAKWSARMTTACLMENDAPGLDDDRFAKWLDCPAHEPFDLTRGLRLRINIYHRAADETVLIVVAHHLVADIWSMTTLTSELETLYLERAGRAPASPPEQAVTDPAVTDSGLVRLHRWVDGRRASVRWESSAKPRSADPSG